MVTVLILGRHGLADTMLIITYEIINAGHDVLNKLVWSMRVPLKYTALEKLFAHIFLL